MNEALVWLLSALPILAAACLGGALGPARLIGAGAPLLCGWAAGIGMALWAFEARWFQPFGLITPAALGIAAALAGRWLSRRPVAAAIELVARRVPANAAGRKWRHGVGSLLGVAGGSIAVASLWVGASLAHGVYCAETAPTAPVEPVAAARDPIAALLETAHHGFVRHIPVVGPLGDEVEALGSILRAPHELRARLAHQARWEGLAELPTLHAILADEPTMADLESAGSGDLAALYRLQKSSLILAFVAERQVQQLLRETRPTLLARQLEALAAEPAGEATPAR